MQTYTFFVRLPSGRVSTCTDRFSERSMVRAIKMMARCGITVMGWQVAR